MTETEPLFSKEALSRKVMVALSSLLMVTLALSVILTGRVVAERLFITNQNSSASSSFESSVILTLTLRVSGAVPVNDTDEVVKL